MSLHGSACKRTPEHVGIRTGDDEVESKEGPGFGQVLVIRYTEFPIAWTDKHGIQTWHNAF